jgi:hypothetical protein
MSAPLAAARQARIDAATSDEQRLPSMTAALGLANDTKMQGQLTSEEMGLGIPPPAADTTKLPDTSTPLTGSRKALADVAAVIARGEQDTPHGQQIIRQARIVAGNTAVDKQLAPGFTLDTLQQKERTAAATPPIQIDGNRVRAESAEQISAVAAAFKEANIPHLPIVGNEFVVTKKANTGKVQNVVDRLNTRYSPITGDENQFFPDVENDSQQAAPVDPAPIPTQTGQGIVSTGAATEALPRTAAPTAEQTATVQKSLGADVRVLTANQLPATETEERTFNSMTKGKGGTPILNQTTTKRMSRYRAALITRLAKLFGDDVVFYEGTSRTSDGFVRTGGNTIHINVDSSVDALAVAGHEFRHTIAKRFSTQHAAIQAAARAILAKDGRMEEFAAKYLKNSDRDEHKGIQKRLAAGKLEEADREYLAEEFSADITGNIWRDTEALREVFDAIMEAHPPSVARDIIKAIGDAIISFINKLILVGNKNGFSSEAGMSQEELVALKTEIKKVMKDAFLAAERTRIGLDPTQNENGTGEVKFENEFTAEDGDVSLPATMFSPHRFNEWEDKTREWMKKEGYSSDEIAHRVEGIRGQMTLMGLTTADVEFFPHGADVSAKGPMRTNDEYHWSFDASAMCVKRLEAASTTSYIQGKLNRPMTASERLALVALFKENDLPAPCLYCYVEAPRSKAGDMVAKGFRALNGEAYSKDWSARTRGIYDAAKQELKDAGVTTDVIDSNVLTDVEYASTPEAETKMRQYPKTYKALREMVLAAKQNAPKVYEEYNGQILKITPKDKAKIQHRAGLRFFSSSDFQAEHVIDLMQAFHDMELGGWLSHVYTKVPSYVDIFGATGQKINMSVFAKEEGGEIVADTWQGNEWDEVKKYRAKHPDVGGILVGSSEKIIHWALQQPWIDFIIPFHHSGLEKKFQEANEWQDFTSTRAERHYPFDAKAKKVKEGFGSIDTSEIGVQAGVTDEEATRRYLTLALERKVSPMFTQFIFKDFKPSATPKATAAANKVAMGRWKAFVDAGEINWDEINPNYFKLKKDYSRTDTPFNPVTANFDMSAAKRVIDSYIKGMEPTAKINQEIGDRLIELINANEGGDVGVMALNAIKASW